MGLVLVSETIKTIGALSWPLQRTSRSGWVVTMDLVLDNSGDKLTFHVKDSFGSSDVLALTAWAASQNLTDWYGDVIDRRAMTIMASHASVVPISPAPYIEAPDAPALYLQVLHQCLGADKILFLGNSDIKNHMPEQTRDLKEKPEAKIQDYPALAALGYVVSAAYLWYRSPEKEIVPNHAAHIIACVEGKKEYEPWAEKFINAEERVQEHESDLW